MLTKHFAFYFDYLSSPRTAVLAQLIRLDPIAGAVLTSQIPKDRDLAEKLAASLFEQIEQEISATKSKDIPGASGIEFKINTPLYDAFLSNPSLNKLFEAITEFQKYMLEALPYRYLRTLRDLLNTEFNKMPNDLKKLFPTNFIKESQDSANTFIQSHKVKLAKIQESPLENNYTRFYYYRSETQFLKTTLEDYFTSISELIFYLYARERNGIYVPSENNATNVKHLASKIRYFLKAKTIDNQEIEKILGTIWVILNPR